MKLNLTKLFAVIGHIAIATPVVIAAVKPVIDEMKKQKRPA